MTKEQVTQRLIDEVKPVWEEVYPNDELWAEKVATTILKIIDEEGYYLESGFLQQEIEK